MITRKRSEVRETKFEKTYQLDVNGRIVLSGEIIKISGEHGARFKFISLVTNKETGSSWIDCFEMDKTMASAWRSFKVDRVKLMPIKRGKKSVD
jgi:hypothetical protein